LTEPDAGVDDGPADARASSPGTDPLARIMFALLVVACVAAFLLTQRIKHTPTAVQNFKLATAFSPYPAGRSKQESISFKLAQADAVTVTIVDSRGDTVATLLRDRPVERYKQLSLRWNGHRGTAHRVGGVLTPAGHAIVVPVNRGKLAAPGEYRVRVALRHQGRSVYSPRSFTLVRP
jgi:hypothetical protein